MGNAPYLFILGHISQINFPFYFYYSHAYLYIPTLVYIYSGGSYMDANICRVSNVLISESISVFPEVIHRGY